LHCQLASSAKDFIFNALKEGTKEEKSVDITEKDILLWLKA
jgi:hypothetical protein